eukprot:2411820-Rhodomonas_salina.1
MASAEHIAEAEKTVSMLYHKVKPDCQRPQTVSQSPGAAGQVWQGHGGEWGWREDEGEGMRAGEMRREERHAKEGRAVGAGAMRG